MTVQIFAVTDIASALTVSDPKTIVTEINPPQIIVLSGTDYIAPFIIPDVDGYIAAASNAFGVLQLNLLCRAYPNYTAALYACRWPDAMFLLNDAVTNSVLTSIQLTEIEQLMVKFNIPSA